MTERGWATREEVDVTAISASGVLIARVSGPGAFTIEATETGEVLINGKPGLYDDEWLDLADIVLMGAPYWALGRTYRVKASLSEPGAIREVTS
jgi:hypothetical protein